jgi:hypothetical protein
MNHHVHVLLHREDVGENCANAPLRYHKDYASVKDIYLMRRVLWTVESLDY